nr:helix-turn-helix domain-containing protein [uncultured Butyricicoccus sp.]
MASKYDTEVKERVLALWASGINARKVSKTVGVPYSTVLDWIHTAQEEDEDFLAARREAKRRAVHRAWDSVQNGINAINKQVKAANRSRAEIDKVINKIAKRGDLTEDDRQALVHIIRNYTDIGIRELTNATKVMFELQDALETRLTDGTGTQMVMIEFDDAEDYAG